MALVIHPMKYPADLQPLPVNSGMLPIDKMQKVPGGGMLHVNAARSWNALVDAALKEGGFKLTYTGTTACYRDYPRQKSLFQERYAVGASGGGCKQWLFKHLGNNLMWCKKLASFATAAVPGTSNHGWGLAIDMALDGYTPDTWKGVTSNPAAHAWLQANVRRFGFSYELQSEPWHIRLVVGDDITPAVLAYENPVTPPPPPIPTPEDDDVQVLLIQDSTGVFVTNDWVLRRAVSHEDIAIFVFLKHTPMNGEHALVVPINEGTMSRMKNMSPGQPTLTAEDVAVVSNAVVSKMPATGGTVVDAIAIANAVAAEIHRRLGS